MDLALALTPFLLYAAASSQGQVLVVDDDGGLGIDFTDLQPAIDAAAEGSVILVKEGVYGPCELDDRALTVCAEAGADVSVEWLMIKNLAAGKVTRVQGLKSLLRTPYVPCSIGSNAGQVWIEDCAFQPTKELAYFEVSVGSAAVEVSGSAGAVLVNVHAKGQTLPGGFATLGSGSYYPPPGPGLLVESAIVNAFDCWLEGGNGAGFTTIPGFYSLTQPGSAGVALPGPGTLHMSASTAIGGQGGPTTDGFLGSCAHGTGGVGIATGCYPGCPEIALHDCSLLGGPGGPAVPFSSCYEEGPPGNPVQLTEGTILVELPLPGLKMEASSPVRENTLLDIALQGPPQALAFLGVSASPDALFVASLGEPLVLASPILALQLGVIPAGGELTLGLPLLELPAGFQSMVFHGQAAYLDPEGHVVLGQPGMVVLLDAGF